MKKFAIGEMIIIVGIEEPLKVSGSDQDKEVVYAWLDGVECTFRFAQVKHRYIPEGVIIMKKPNITEVKKHVINNGGTFKKDKYKLILNDAYVINGAVMTKKQAIDSFVSGAI